MNRVRECASFSISSAIAMAKSSMETLLPASLASNLSLPIRNLPVRRPGANIGDGERYVQSRLGCVRSRSRNPARQASPFVGLQKLRSVDQLHTWSHFEAPGAADDQVASRSPDLATAAMSLMRSLAVKCTELTTTSCPLKAVAIAVMLSVSTLFGVTPGSDRTFSRLRAMAVSANPRRGSSARIREPAFPVAPMTAICRSLF